MSVYDKPPDRAVNIGTYRFWKLGLNTLNNGLAIPVVRDDYDTAILQAPKFGLAETGLRGAPQLALLRHLWAEAVRAAAPGAIIFGGQHHWQDAWWSEPIDAR